MPSHTSSGPLAAAAGTITLGNDLTVNRMGFGAMRLAGKGIWGPPADPQEAVRSRKEEVVLVIREDFADDFKASKPAQIRLVSDAGAITG